MEHSHDNTINLIAAFNNSIAAHLPALEKEVDALIGSQSKDEKAIEHMIDCLFDLTVYVGIGEKLFLRLLDYYKTINPEAADWYCQEYEAEKEK
jgi:hypothetical protein